MASTLVSLKYRIHTFKETRIQGKEDYLSLIALKYYYHRKIIDIVRQCQVDTHIIFKIWIFRPFALK